MRQVGCRLFLLEAGASLAADFREDVPRPTCPGAGAAHGTGIEGLEALEAFQKFLLFSIYLHM